MGSGPPEQTTPGLQQATAVLRESNALAAEQLRASELRFRAQYKSLPIPVYSWHREDDDFVLIDYNLAAEQITEGNVAELLGARASRLYHDAPDILQDMQTCFHEQRSFHREMLYQFRSTRDVKYLSVSYGFVPPDIVLVHTVDATARVEAERALHELSRELEHRVEKRTAELKQANRALRASERRYRLLAENATDMISRHTPEGLYLYASPACRRLLGYEPGELVGQQAYELFHPGDLDAIRRSHSTIMEEPTVYTVAYRIRRRDGGYLWVETTSKTIRHEESGQIEEIVAITRDISERKQAEEALQASERQLRALYAQLEDHSRNLEDKVAARTREIEQRRQVAESLRGMLTVLNSDLPLGEILEHIVAEAGRLLGSQTSAIYGSVAGEDSFTPRTVRGVDADLLAGMPFPAELTTALRVGQPVAVPNLADGATDSVLASSLGCMAGCCQALLAVPLIVKREVYGSLVLYYSEPRDVSDEEMALAIAFADQAALAIENARLQEQVREAAVVEERARLARELHDSVTQSLFSITLLAEAGQRLAGSGDLERVRTYLNRLGQMSHQSLKEMRLLVYELRPLALESAGLVTALQNRLDAVEARAGIETRLLAEDAVQVPPVVEENLYRIAEQALNNALKHAAATLVTVQVQASGTGVAVEVTDNGTGFDLDAIKEHGGHGLKSMHERAVRIGGRLAIQSSPSRGTKVRIDVALEGDPVRNTGSGDR